MCPEVNGIIFHDWRIITGGMNCVIHEPVTDSVNFDVFIKYAAVHTEMQSLR